MVTKTWVPGTVIDSPWLQDVNDLVYKAKDSSGIVPVNVKSPTYGAIGDGVVDDTAALQAAIAAAAVVGKEVFFPPGSYKISSTLTIPANVTLKGSGPRHTLFLIAPSLTGTAVALNGDGASLYELGFTSAAQRVSGAYIALNANTRSNVIEDFWMANACIGIHVGANSSNPVLTHINRGEIVNNTALIGIAIKISGGNDTYISNVFTQGIPGVLNEPECGYSIENTSAIWMYNCGALFSRIGLYIRPGTGEAITWLFLHSCAFDTGVDQAINITPAGTGSVRGITFIDCWGATSDRGFYINASGSTVIDGIEMVGCRFINNQKEGGLVLGNAINISVRSSTITGNSGNGVGNHPGLSFGTSVTKYNVTDCLIGNAYGFSVSQNYGISIGLTNNNFIITGNTVTGNLTGGILNNSGSATVANVTNNLGYINSNFGNASGTTDGSGDITVTHGLSGTPTTVNAMLIGVPAVAIFGVHTITATTFKIRFWDGAAAGAALVGFAIANCSWEAKFK